MIKEKLNAVAIAQKREKSLLNISNLCKSMGSEVIIYCRWLVTVAAELSAIWFNVFHQP